MAISVLLLYIDEIHVGLDHFLRPNSAKKMPRDS